MNDIELLENAYEIVESLKATNDKHYGDGQIDKVCKIVELQLDKIQEQSIENIGLRANNKAFEIMPRRLLFQIDLLNEKIKNLETIIDAMTEEEYRAVLERI